MEQWPECPSNKEVGGVVGWIGRHPVFIGFS